jgi:multidrug efflux pump subunit AcrA (membrane-fusion protein)
MMKPILLSMNEMSDSREVYESKPNIFFSIFIYSILGMLLIALIWMYFGRIDIVVKSEGMLRPNNQVATVLNTYSGTLEKVNIQDGATVKEGDVLYVVEHEELLTELDYYEEQRKEVGTHLGLLERYKRSIEDGINYFTASPAEEEYYIKYQAFEINYELMEKDIIYSDEERKLNLKTVNKQLEDLYARRDNSEKLKRAIAENKNLFVRTGDEKEYYNLYLKYQSDYNSLITQYDNKKIEIDNSTTEEGLINSLEYYQRVRDGLKQLKSSVTKGRSLFEETSSYSLQYEEYVNKVADLTASYEQAKDAYAINKELAGLAVTEWEVQQSKKAMEEAERAVETYEAGYLANLNSGIIEVEKNIKELNLSKENTLTKDELYKKNEIDKASALDNFRLKYLVELDNAIASLKDSIRDMEANKYSLDLLGQKTVIYEEAGTEANLFKYRNNELGTTIASINAYQDKQSELLAGIDKINGQISEAIVEATKTGVINTYVELVEGDVLSGGTQVLTIIPEEGSEFKASVYVSNEDIGKLSEGMEVKFNIYALPSREYGYITGTVMNISKDLKVDSESGSGYYMVEAKLDHKDIYDSQGNKALLKVGMACQAQMITESKRILSYVLERIDLLVK